MKERKKERKKERERERFLLLLFFNAVALDILFKFLPCQAMIVWLLI